MRFLSTTVDHADCVASIPATRARSYRSENLSAPKDLHREKWESIICPCEVFLQLQKYISHTSVFPSILGLRSHGGTEHLELQSSSGFCTSSMIQCITQSERVKWEFITTVVARDVDNRRF